MAINVILQSQLVLSDAHYARRMYFQITLMDGIIIYSPLAAKEILEGPKFTDMTQVTAILNI